MVFKDLGMIVAAGGSGSRFSSQINKLLVNCHGKPILVLTLEKFISVIEPGKLVVAAPEDQLALMRDLTDKFLPGNQIRWTPGGATRVASVARAAALLPTNIRWVAIHDAARPLADVSLLEELLRTVREVGGAVPGIKMIDTVKLLDDSGLIAQNLIRKDLAAVATPQVFDYLSYMHALQALAPEIVDGTYEDAQLTDDTAIFMRSGGKVKVVYTNNANPKITTPEDLSKLN